MAGTELLAQLPRQPHRPGLLLRRIPTRRRLTGPSFVPHDSILVSKVRSLQATRTVHLASYAASFGAPVHAGMAVTRVQQTGSGFTVRTDRCAWRAATVIIATGWCDQPRIPGLAGRLSPSITQVTASTYRNPAQLPTGGVLVVGASASGVQLADELARVGRPVTLAVGRHRRLPRRYRGRDIWRWLEQIGTFRVTIDDVVHPVRVRGEGALQLIGRDHPDVDLPGPAGTRRPADRPAQWNRRSPRRIHRRPRCHRRRRRLSNAPRPLQHRRPHRYPWPGLPSRAANHTKHRCHATGRSSSRSAPGWDQHGALGDWVYPRVPVAAGTRPGRRRRDPTIPRCDPGRRVVRSGAALPTPPRLGLHRRRRS